MHAKFYYQTLVNDKKTAAEHLKNGVGRGLNILGQQIRSRVGFSFEPLNKSNNPTPHSGNNQNTQEPKNSDFKQSTLPNSDSTGSNPSLNTNNNTGSPQAQAQKPLSKVESAQAKIDSLNKMSNKDIGTSVVSSMIKDKKQELKNYKGADLTAKATAPN